MRMLGMRISQLQGQERTQAQRALWLEQQPKPTAGDEQEAKALWADGFDTCEIGEILGFPEVLIVRTLSDAPAHKNPCPGPDLLLLALRAADGAAE